VIGKLETSADRAVPRMTEDLIERDGMMAGYGRVARKGKEGQI